MYIITRRKKPSDEEVDRIPVEPNPHHSSNIVSLEENVINNTEICVHQLPDVIVDANNQEGNEQQEYETISYVKAQPPKERRTEPDYISHNIMLRDPHLNSSPQQVTLFAKSSFEASNNHEYVV